MNKKTIIIPTIIIILIISVGTAYCTGTLPNTYSKFTHTQDFGNFTMEIPNDVNLKKTYENNSLFIYNTTTNDKFQVRNMPQEEGFGTSLFDILINEINKNESYKTITEHDFSNNCKVYEVVRDNDACGNYLVVILIDNQIIMIYADDLDVIKQCLETVKVKNIHVKEDVTKSNNTTEVSETKPKNNTKSEESNSDDYQDEDYYDYEDEDYYDYGYDYDDEGNRINYGEQFPPEEW